jgi:hypothetical protein
MFENIRLRLHIEKTVMGTIEIDTIVCILPKDTKLVRFDLGPCLVEGAGLVLLNYTIWVEKILDVWGQ